MRSFAYDAVLAVLLTALGSAAVTACGDSERDAASDAGTGGGTTTGGSSGAGGGSGGAGGAGAGSSTGGTISDACSSQLCVDACNALTGACPADTVLPEDCAEACADIRCSSGDCLAAYDAYLACQARTIPDCVYGYTTPIGDCRSEARARAECLGWGWSCGVTHGACLCVQAPAPARTCSVGGDACCQQSQVGDTCRCSACYDGWLRVGFVAVDSCPPP